jgi:hypothetical protein
MNCENCGIPKGSYSRPGFMLTLQFMPHVGEKWKRQQTRTVWTCGSQCAVQTMAIAAMGLPSHKWPMSLKEFTSQMQAAGKLDFLAPESVANNVDETRENSGNHEIEFCETVLEALPRFATLGYKPELTIDGLIKQPRTGGRPPSEEPKASTLRSRRFRARHPQPSDGSS